MALSRVRHRPLGHGSQEAAAHGSRRIIGCPSSFFSGQNLSPRGIISSTKRASRAFSVGLTMLALTCEDCGQQRACRTLITQGTWRPLNLPGGRPGPVANEHPPFTSGNTFLFLRAQESPRKPSLVPGTELPRLCGRIESGPSSNHALFFAELTGLSGGEMIRISRGRSSVKVAVALNSDLMMGCSDAMKLCAISSLATRV